MNEPVKKPDDEPVTTTKVETHKSGSPDLADEPFDDLDEEDSEDKDESPALALVRRGRPSVFTTAREHLQNLSLLQNDLFLGILALTFLNALIFLHYARQPDESMDLRTANRIVHEELRKDSDFFDPISDFTNEHGNFHSVEEPAFATSLARFRSRLSRLEADSTDLFFLDEFVEKNGGLYWSKKADRAPTAYQPITP